MPAWRQWHVFLKKRDSVQLWRNVLLWCLGCSICSCRRGLLQNWEQAGQRGLVLGWIRPPRVTGYPGFLGQPGLRLLPEHIINSALLHSQNVLVWMTNYRHPTITSSHGTLYFLLMAHRISSVQLLSCVQLFVTPWTTARQASLSITNSRSPPKSMSTESMMPSNHLILCHPLLLLPSIFPRIGPNVNGVWSLMMEVKSSSKVNIMIP